MYRGSVSALGTTHLIHQTAVTSLHSSSLGASPCAYRRAWELQSLADQEKISPAAIKKTTLDKVLQQPGISDTSGGTKNRVNLFNNKSGVKKV
ncbi:hypothetical protein NFI96_006770 [Prochilodus magdalenae]|nr:hypothetical protein NFI96_006770 [Prochilodus magdalenae]